MDLQQRWQSPRTDQTLVPHFVQMDLLEVPHSPQMDLVRRQRGRLLVEKLALVEHRKDLQMQQTDLQQLAQLVVVVQVHPVLQADPLPMLVQVQAAVYLLHLLVVLR